MATAWVCAEVSMTSGPLIVVFAHRPAVGANETKDDRIGRVADADSFYDRLETWAVVGMNPREELRGGESPSGPKPRICERSRCVATGRCEDPTRTLSPPRRSALPA